ncbi:MAG: sugar nucleotide-binding protein [Planctomycetia bacterium]|nr:sugar nucleotide-binding protein [Planctomycetia bacterium]
MWSAPSYDISHRLPLLITGITGVAGFNALDYFQRRYPGQVFGVRPVQTLGMNGPGIISLNAEEFDGLRELFEVYRFRAVLNCVGNCALKSCEKDPVMARTLNITTAVAVAELARKHGARLVHLSSDLVFSGERPGGYVETDPVDPVTVYGKTMAEAEGLIARIAPGAAVLRISLPMGPSFSDHAGAIDWIMSRFRKDRPATLYFDEVRSCTYVEDLSAVFAAFLAGEQHGLYHLGGPRPVTLYQIGQIVNRVGGFAPALLHGCPRHAAGPMPPRAGNVAMNSDKLIAALGGNPFRPWPALDDLVPDSRDWHRERPPGEVGSRQRIDAVLYRVHGG